MRLFVECFVDCNLLRNPMNGLFQSSDYETKMMISEIDQFNRFLARLRDIPSLYIKNDFLPPRYTWQIPRTIRVDINLGLSIDFQQIVDTTLLPLHRDNTTDQHCYSERHRSWLLVFDTNSSFHSCYHSETSVFMFLLHYISNMADFSLFRFTSNIDSNLLEISTDVV